jgi:hypothetical protein
MTYQTKFRTDLILGLATWGPKPKTDMTPELMAGSSPSFYHRYKDTTYPGFLFDLLFKVTGVKVQNIQSWLVLLLFDLECSNFARTSWFVTCICHYSFISAVDRVHVAIDALISLQKRPVSFYI